MSSSSPHQFKDASLSNFLRIFVIHPHTLPFGAPALFGVLRSSDWSTPLSFSFQLSFDFHEPIVFSGTPNIFLLCHL